MKASDERWIEYDIAAFLRKARLADGVSQVQVALKLELNHVTVWGWENDVSWPGTLARFGRWCGCYGLEVEVVIKERGGPIVYSRKL